MPLNNEILIMVEYNKKYLRLHYADGHYEIINGYIHDYVVKKKKGYKNPICIRNYYLYPTKNIHDISCQWINLELYEENNHYYRLLLENYHLENQVRKMYLKHKKDVLNE